MHFKKQENIIANIIVLSRKNYIRLRKKDQSCRQRAGLNAESFSSDTNTYTHTGRKKQIMVWQRKLESYPSTKLEDGNVYIFVVILVCHEWFLHLAME